MGVSQIIERETNDGWHEVTVITDAGSVSTNSYFLDCDREHIVEDTIKEALDKD